VIVRRLAEVGSAEVASAGGKAAGLGELARAGLPVPPGYVVLASAFGEAVAAMDPPLPSVEVLAVPGVAQMVRERLAACPLPASVAAEITAAYESLWCGGPDVPVAVRSSATMEDSAVASFAGLQDTYLGVRGAAAVLDAVRRCWASLYNDESVAYRRRLDLPEAGLAMGVVVQRMVRPRAAGVMFTRSPVTGDRSVVAIEGTWGLGSALVAGEVTPDRFTVSKVTGEITGRKVGAKQRLHSFGPNEPGISASAMPLALRGRPCLTDDEARALASVGSRVEEHYGQPQDIEWALIGSLPSDRSELHGDPADRIRLLQSRPETVWAARSPDPVATPKPRASDHVLAWLEKPL
jgi:pyruvate,water dikinase